MTSVDRQTRASCTGMTVPWRVGDLTVMACANLLAFIGIVAAWFGGGGTADVASQVGWLRLGVAAVAVAGLGNALWILSGMRAVGARRRQVLSRAARSAEIPIPLGKTRRSSAVEVDPTSLVSGPRMTRYHRPDCPAATNRPVEVAELTSHVRNGRRPCGLCRPEGWTDTGALANG